jgi:hypothetical protein
MPSLAVPIAAARASMNITVKRTGRVRPPNLSDPQLKKIGDTMVTAQKLRWEKAMNAEGQIAKKLSVRWAIIKQAVLHKRPERDMKLTGRTIKNFQLRKAADGRIRAENTTRYERSKALGCNSYDQMIGFSLFETRMVIAEAQAEYGQYVKTAWIPLDQTSRRPSTLNVNTP